MRRNRLVSCISLSGYRDIPVAVEEISSRRVLGVSWSSAVAPESYVSSCGDVCGYNGRIGCKVVARLVIVKIQHITSGCRVVQRPTIINADRVILG